jgi:DNA-binding NtrC family response regulator
MSLSLAVDFAQLNLVGQSDPFLAALAQIQKFAQSDATVLIQGETGTGKELAARAIHSLGSRRGAPFVPVNCGAVPDTLLESEFFGHMRGAFTDAKESRAGVIEQAERGTLFLDELEELTARGQAVLLRFLQDHVYRAVGGTVIRKANVRILASTNADLMALARQGRFRTDLLYRLGVLTLNLPPLRERIGDPVLLAERFVDRFAAQYGTTPRPLDPASRRYLDAYSWPGNVRELENTVHRTLVLSEGLLLSFPDIETESLNEIVCDPPASALVIHQFRQAKARAIEEFERRFVCELLERTRGNISLAARLSGQERSRLGKLIKKHDLDRSAYMKSRKA